MKKYLKRVCCNCKFWDADSNHTVTRKCTNQVYLDMYDMEECMCGCYASCNFFKHKEEARTLNIHEKINARSWYAGDILALKGRELMLVRIQEDGTEHYTPTRLRIHAPYKITGLKTEKPRFKKQFYQIMTSSKIAI